MSTMPEPTPVEEEKQSAGVRVNLTPTEYARLQAIAEAEDRSVSNVVRRAVRDLLAANA